MNNLLLQADSIVTAFDKLRKLKKENPELYYKICKEEGLEDIIDLGDDKNEN